jgi:acetyl-CoA carboxylase carboxyl transferase subunit beta
MGILSCMRLGARSRPAPSDAFLQCANCKKTLFRREFEQNFNVCPACGHNHRITAWRRIEMTFDEGSFEELDADLRSGDPLQFPDYADKLAQAVSKSGQNDCIVSGMAKLDGREVSAAVSDFTFMGGSMGSVAGEKIARALDRASERKVPAIVFCASGGARMQEGLYSLMTLPKTLAGVQRCRQARVPYIAVMSDPTMAGVLASYASVADIILAEPKAMIGFAGTRVSRQAQVLKMPDDFQTSEFVLRCGMVDRIVPRREIRATLCLIVRIFAMGVR